MRSGPPPRASSWRLSDSPGRYGVYSAQDPYAGTASQEFGSHFAAGLGAVLTHPTATAEDAYATIAQTVSHGTAAERGHLFGDALMRLRRAALRSGPKVAGRVGLWTEAAGATKAAGSVATAGQDALIEVEGETGPGSLRWTADQGGEETCTGEGCPVGNCFAAGTLVDTEEGLRPIDTLHVGDRVLSRNPTTGAMAYKPVLRTIVTEHRALTQIALTSRAGDEEIRVTPNHPFFVRGRG